MNTQIEKRLKTFEKKGIDRRYFFKQMAMAGLLPRTINKYTCRLWGQHWAPEAPQGGDRGGRGQACSHPVLSCTQGRAEGPQGPMGAPRSQEE